MPWTTPEVPRINPPYLADELDTWLDWHRQTLLIKCAGLTAKARSCVRASLWAST